MTATVLLVLGDQLNRDASVFDGCAPADTTVLMIEAAGEAEHVPSHKARTTLFLAAMRHFAQALRDEGWRVDYQPLDDDGPAAFADRLALALRRLAPARLQVTEPGEWRLRDAIAQTCAAAGVAIDLTPDRHFLCSTDAFTAWAGRRGSLRMEWFYRWMRTQHRVLVDAAGAPEGGRWNFDADNRSGFGRAGPGLIPPPAQFAPDAVTRDVIALVERRFPDHPGATAAFCWPVTRAQALEALRIFIDDRLPSFGHWQDAMWTDTPFGWHALLSSSLNLKLLDPREVIAAAVAAYENRRAPLASVEGFVRQILGWREFVRGAYWLRMPALRDANHFGHRRPLPAWFWNADTQMACLQAAIGQTLEYGYAHHIQRLMVIGNFAVLAELSPQRVEDWFLGVYVDAIEWVELPNVASMALYADGGGLTSKPYLASGAYIKRMSNYCTGCRYRPEQRTGDHACPVTTLYWRFLLQHQAALAANPRMTLIVSGLKRLDAEERDAIASAGDALLNRLDTL